MSNKLSQLKQLVIPESRVKAFPVDPETPMGEPHVVCSVLVEDDGEAHHFVHIEWGKESTTPYTVSIFVFGTVLIGNEQWEKDNLEKELLAGIGACISAAREHLAAVTARGPHGYILLPLVRISVSQIDIRAKPQAAARYGFNPQATDESE